MLCTAQAQLKIKHAGNIMTCRAKLPEGAHPETTPCIFQANGRYYITITTGFSVLIPFRDGMEPKDLFDREDVLSLEEAHIVTDSFVGYGASQNGGDWTPEKLVNADASWQEGHPYWQREYFGLFDLSVIEQDGKQYLLGVMHGENKNEKFLDGRKYLNSIQPKRAYRENEYSGPEEKNGRLEYDDYGASYFAFISTVLVPLDRMSERFDTPEFQQGPIVWPTTGYLNPDNTRANSGLRHPSMFVAEGKITLYYLDADKIRSAQAPLEALGRPGSFLGCRDGAYTVPMLPDGFTKDSRAFFGQGVGSMDVMTDSSCSIRFSVAKIKDSDYYLGIEEYSDCWPQCGLRFRLSNDMVHWSDPCEIPDMSYANYNDGSLHYPAFLNQQMESTGEIALDDFYIVGEYGCNIGHPVIQCRHFSLTLQTISK